MPTHTGGRCSVQGKLLMEAASDVKDGTYVPGKRLDEMVEESNDTGAWYPGKLVHDAVEDMENGTYVPGAEIHKMVTKSEENGSWFPGALHATALPTSRNADAPSRSAAL